MSSNYPKPDQNINFAKLEQDILGFWQENKVCEKSIEIRDDSDLEEDNVSPVTEPCALKDHTHCRHNHEDEKSEFVFYDGPPFANGLPHYGHLLTGFIKDLFARYQTMKGKKVERKFGWDTHGLPVEMETEKELGVSGQIAIEEYGIDKFNDACKKSVMKYADEWEKYVTRQGRWVDFKNDYKTMDINYMESVLWAFKELHKKGLLYEDYRVVPYSWACQTPLSNFETRMDNSYREKKSKAVTLKFQLSDESAKKLGCAKPVFVSAWTTTPWTLPSNLALGVGRDIEYVAIDFADEVLIVAKNLVEKFTKDFDLENKEHELKDLKGEDLLGLSYLPLFPYFKNNAGENSFKILHGDFVTTDEGTGIVHLAPAFGEDDQLLCKKEGIPTICPVDEAGKFAAAKTVDENGDVKYVEVDDLNIGDLTISLNGRQVFETNDDVIKYLKAKDLWIKTDQYIHNYPHCWRTDTPLIYKAVSSWYVKVTDFKDRMVELNQGINWIPDHIKDGQFGKWLEGARDWSISRNRFWGCPVPVWVSDDSKYPRIDVYGSLDELEADFGVRPDNLHRPYIDNLTRLNPDDPRSDASHPEHANCSKMNRVSDVLDCWFESGSMPYAQVHYPFENKEWFEENFPADFITEYVAQTRGWFYTMMVLSTAIFDRAPFKNVICHGTILDENAQKLSKRLRNYPDPIEMFDEIGSDALRFYMISQAVMRGQELKIEQSGKSFRDSLRISIKPLTNAFNFFCLYANSDGIKAKKIEYSREFTNPLDNYILAKLKVAVSKIDESLGKYDTVSACAAFNDFFEVLNNWYIRRSRQRFWASEKSQEKQDAYDVLYSCLLYMCEAGAPLLPFAAEYVWRGLRGC